MTCAQCGAANHGDARFCGVCGTATSPTEPASSPSLGEAPAMIGREIAGRYRMLAKLGEGGMGTVFRAEQISLKRTVAVKLLRPDVLGNQLVLRRFNAEAEVVARLSHPNTVNIYDFGQDTDGTLFIAMEYIEGRSLRSVIHQEAPLSPRRALAIAHQVAASLADAHARAIIHRDLKPDNVMLQDRGKDHDIARVLDFGIAKLRDDTRATQMQMTQQGDMLGTPQYMAPEQIRAEAIDGRTDIYALGCLLYEMVTARLPHDAPTVLAMLSKHLLEHPVPPSRRRPELALSPALDALILGAMAKDPAGRPATMEVVGEQIAALLAQQPPDPRSRRPVTGSAAVAPTGMPSSAGPASQPGQGGRAVAIETPAAYSAHPLSALPAPPAPGPAAAPYHAPAGPGPYHAPAAPYHAPGAPAAPGPYPASAAPYPAPAAPAAPYHVPVAHPARRPAPHPGHRLSPLVIAGVVVAALSSVTLFVLEQRRHTEPPPAPPVAPTPPGPVPAPPGPDPWRAQALPGNKLGVGQGVYLDIPPQFQTTTQGALTGATDGGGLAIFAGPIELASNDPMDLARDYARRNHVTFDVMKSIRIGGMDRPLLAFHGKLNGVVMRQIGVPLIGPGYRIAVIFQAPAQRLDTDRATQGVAFELFTQRIMLP
jgi:serine/threonine protein kinase